jgi:hypothetical protein
MADANPSGQPNSTTNRKPGTPQHPGDIGAPLAELDLDKWCDMKEEDRLDFLQSVNTSYYSYVSEFYQVSNDCVDRYDALSKQNRRWRQAVISGTGIVAAFDLLAANYKIAAWSKNIVPIVAAMVALGLTVLANLESFYHFGERARAFRESREIFLDAARESHRMWEIYVRPFGPDASACQNAAELYRRIVAVDRDLRGKLKESTMPRDAGKSSGAHGN